MRSFFVRSSVENFEHSPVGGLGESKNVAPIFLQVLVEKRRIFLIRSAMPTPHVPGRQVVVRVPGLLMLLRDDSIGSCSNNAGDLEQELTAIVGPSERQEREWEHAT